MYKAIRKKKDLKFKFRYTHDPLPSLLDPRPYTRVFLTHMAFSTATRLKLNKPKQLLFV